MQVELFKKEGTYPDKTTGEDKPFTNLYLRAGSAALIPIEVKNFSKSDNPDKQYGPRRAVLSAFADKLPPLIIEEEASES